MVIASNVTRLAPLIADLVNLVTPKTRGGGPARGLEGEDLVSAFTALMSGRTSDALRAVPDAGRRLEGLAWELREALVADTPADKAGHINTMIGRYGAQPCLVDDVDQPFHLHFHGTTGNELDKLGAEFATALALIMDGYGADRFGRCEARLCDAVYIDMTRNGRRRYCSAGCTARAKTAAYRSRNRQLTRP